LLEGGAGALEVGEFHLGIFTGEDDAVGIAVEGGEDGIADAVGRALAVGGLGGDVDVDAGPEQGVGVADAGAGGGTDPMSQRRDMGHPDSSRNRE